MMKRLLVFVLSCFFAICATACGQNAERQAEQGKDVQNMTNKAADNRQLKIEANGKVLYADFAKNSSAEALKALLAKNAITVDMHDYGDFEKVGPLGHTLPRNDTPTRTGPGDVILYQGNNIVVYYGNNSWNFTPIAKVPNTSRAKMLEVLGNGDPKVKFSLADKK